MKIDKNAINQIDQIPHLADRILAAAELYVKNGIYVIPIRPNGKAIPPKSTGISYHHCTKNIATVRKWFKEGGPFRGWNVGIACGMSDGVFVVDVDRKPGNAADGVAQFKAIRPEGWRHKGPKQTTPNGGYHLFFKWRPNARCTSEKIARGIDTRGGQADKAQGHVVVWPSEINGTGYAWTKFGEFADCPDWIVDLLGDQFKKKPIGRGNELVGSEDIEDKFTLESIGEMLSVLDPNDLPYDEWLRVGQAIHTQHPNEAGARLWDSWSKRGDRYSPGECFKRWDGFSLDGTVRIGTLIAYAQGKGFKLNKLEEVKRDHDDKIAQLIDEMNEIYAVCPLGTDVVIIEKCDVVEEMKALQPTYRFWKRQGFRNFFENKVMITVNAAGKPKKESVADIWLTHPEREMYTAGVGLFPNKPARYHDHFNLWQGFTHEPAPGKWDLFKDHIRQIICDGDDGLFNWVLDWMADILQDPGNPKGTAIVMHGIEGCGKGTFCHIFGKLFGCHYKHLTDQEHLVGRFNGHMADAIFVFADEAVFGGDRKIAGKLKALVTESVMTSERKGVDATQFRNCTHLVAASNESWFIPAGPQSRRWLVLDVCPDRANDLEYFTLIHKEAENGGISAMMHDLLNRRIKSNLRTAPETKALQMQRSQYASMDSVVDWWTDQLYTGVLAIASMEDESPDRYWPDRVTKNDMIKEYQRWCVENKRRKVSNARFYATMKQAGLQDIRLRGVGGQRPYGYNIPDRETCVKIATKEFGFVIQEE